MLNESHIEEAALEWFEVSRTKDGLENFATPEMHRLFADSSELQQAIKASLGGLGYGG